MTANIAALSLRHGMDFSVPNVSTHNFWNPIYLPHLHKPFNRNLPNVTIKENQFHYAPIQWNDEWNGKNVQLDGYWQSYKYFHEYRDWIIDMFDYQWYCIDDVCSIHARYGDYLTIQGKHILLTREYLETAMNLVMKEKGIRKFKVFSDSIPDFKSRFGSLYDFEYSTNVGIEEDLVEISCCSSNIGSSSTFSFWAAYLNRNTDKMVIQQSKWFQDGWKDEYGRLVDTKDVLLPEWIKIAS